MQPATAHKSGSTECESGSSFGGGRDPRSKPSSMPRATRQRTRATPLASLGPLVRHATGGARSATRGAARTRRHTCMCDLAVALPLSVSAAPPACLLACPPGAPLNQCCLTPRARQESVWSLYLDAVCAEALKTKKAQRLVQVRAVSHTRAGDSEGAATAVRCGVCRPTAGGQPQDELPLARRLARLAPCTPSALPLHLRPL